MAQSIAVGLFVVAVAVVGIAGNLLTLVALATSQRVRSASAAFIASLSVADLLFCALNLPFSASRFLHGSWAHGERLCWVVAAGRYFNVGISLLSITAITVNRYVLIVHPGAYERLYGRRSIIATVAFTWVLPAVVLIPTALGAWGRFGLEPQRLNCSIVPVEGKSAKAFLFVCAFVVPCLAIIVCYARIFWTVRKSRLQLASHQGEAAKRRKDEWRLTRMVLFIFCSFVACYLPITIVKVADPDVLYPSVHLVGYVLLYLSACVNPLIYGVTNQQYRQAYHSTLAPCFPCLLARRHGSSHYGSEENTPAKTMVSVIAMHTLSEA
ncbi:G-protein coupled receptor moody-like [Ornithodoros turicata]|uniref:G-protein coupled receptor moody-like n=1 Tax=Ornithodoros turicata TaxID=34597 RepID=UPI0031388227